MALREAALTGTCRLGWGRDFLDGVSGQEECGDGAEARNRRAPIGIEWSMERTLDRVYRQFVVEKFIFPWEESDPYRYRYLLLGGTRFGNDYWEGLRGEEEGLRILSTGTIVL